MMRGLHLTLVKRLLVGTKNFGLNPVNSEKLCVRGLSTFGIDARKDDKSLGDTLSRVHQDLLKLRQILDTHVIGHSDIKDAMILGLVSREHVYVEGPPGVAKTMLSELVSESASLSHWFYQMHRDVRLSELIGETVIVKENKDGKGEVIRQDILRGGILDCQIAVLDDISRAPGEALNVLLRILNERNYAGGSHSLNHQKGEAYSNKIPLISAIATGNPASDDAYYAEPLDPATLDRFTFQLRSYGLVNEGDWSAVESVIDLYAQPHEVNSRKYVDTLGHRNTLQTAGELVPLVILGEDTKRALIKFLKILRDEFGLSEENSLLSDRTFLVKAVQALKAKAILNGRFICEPLDLFVLRYLTTFRVPENVHENIEEIIEKAISTSDKSSQIPSGTDDNSTGGVTDSEQESDSDTNSASKTNFNEGNREGSIGNDENNNGQPKKNSETRRIHGDNTDAGESGNSEMDVTSSDSSSSSDATSVASEPESNHDNSSSVRNQVERARSKPDDTTYPDAKRDRDKSEYTAPWNDGDKMSVPTVNNLDTLLKRLEGRLDRGSASHDVNSGGVPRSWTRLRSFSDLNDTDSVETSLWCSDPSPLLPRSHYRTRKTSGGRVAILRDTSMSMGGLWNGWASTLCSNVINIASKRRMHVGYLEFNDKISKHTSRKNNFFTNDYTALMKRMAMVKCDGLTNYELPLSAALYEFEKLRRNKAAMYCLKNPDQHILFITDGQPTAGDRYVVRELKKAKDIGVAIHTVFIGYISCPKVLDRLSKETNGLMYSAYFDTTSKRIEVVERASMAAFETERSDLDVQKLNMMARLPSVFQRYLDENGLTS